MLFDTVDSANDTQSCDPFNLDECEAYCISQNKSSFEQGLDKNGCPECKCGNNSKTGKANF